MGSPCLPGQTRRAGVAGEEEVVVGPARWGPCRHRRCHLPDLRARPRPRAHGAACPCPSLPTTAPQPGTNSCSSGMSSSRPSASGTRHSPEWTSLKPSSSAAGTDRRPHRQQARRTPCTLSRVRTRRSLLESRSLNKRNRPCSSPSPEMKQEGHREGNLERTSLACCAAPRRREEEQTAELGPASPPLGAIPKVSRRPLGGASGARVPRRHHPLGAAANNERTNAEPLRLETLADSFDEVPPKRRPCRRRRRRHRPTRVAATTTASMGVVGTTAS
mmetsp:Transcript_960/g.3148  ORF Transcript_960/g.3148 Transcript_960/m.3148 type:complete len:275 (+) Transcript_960:2378-3202(+)